MKHRVCIHAFNTIIEKSKATGAAQAFLLVLCRWSDEDGVCWPEVPRIAEAMHYSRRTVERIQRGLIADGELQIRTGRGRGCRNTYVITCLQQNATTVVALSAENTTTVVALSGKSELEPPGKCDKSVTENATNSGSLPIRKNNQKKKNQEDGNARAQDRPLPDFNKILESIGTKGDVSPQIFRTWFRPVQLELFAGDVLTLSVPNQHFVDFFYAEPEERIRPILRSVRAAGLRVSEITFVARDKESGKVARAPPVRFVAAFNSD